MHITTATVLDTNLCIINYKAAASAHVKTISTGNTSVTDNLTIYWHLHELIVHLPISIRHWPHKATTLLQASLSMQETEQEFSYRQQIASQLRTQYAEGIYRHKTLQRDLEI